MEPPRRVQQEEGVAGSSSGSGGTPGAELAGMQVSVIGLGASGIAAARLAANRGAEVYVSEIRENAQTRAGRDGLVAHAVEVELGRHDIERMAGADLVVVSPGIPPDAPVLTALRDRGIGWISEPEFASRFLPGALIAVTGTNGKSTTAALIAHVMADAGMDVALGGNVGGGIAPAASVLADTETPPGWAVLELSSFQLADIERFRPDIGVITNLAPDHLDRYETVEDYYADKARIFENATEESRWVLNGDDAAVLALAGGAPGKRYLFSVQKQPDRGAFVRDEVLSLRVADENETVLSTDRLPLFGASGVANALAASLAARLAGVTPQAIARGLESFRALPDRMEPVGSVDGVLWINDSKATNVAAARSAIRSVNRPVVVLLGGKDKGEELLPLREALEEVGARAVVFGAAGDRIWSALDGTAIERTRVVGSFEEAVEAGRRMTRPGDALLLAPACSSFDMFSDYAARGRRFRELASEAGRGETGGNG